MKSCFPRPRRLSFPSDTSCLHLFRVWSNEWPIYMLLYDNFVVNYGFARICLVTLFKINHQNLERLLNNFKLNWTRHVQDIIQKKISASLAKKILFESKYSIVQELNLYIDKFRNVSITFHVKLRGEVSCHVTRATCHVTRTEVLSRQLDGTYCSTRWSVQYQLRCYLDS